MQGKMNMRLHRQSHINFNLRYTSAERAGYYIWAVPAVKHMRKYPTSLWSKALKVIVTSAVKHIAAFPKDHYLAPKLFDHAVYYTGRTICWAIAKTVARKFEFNQSMLGDKNV